MFPVIEVQCPFCKATGQIMAPPPGSIIVGPCPRCNEMVLLFNGAVMPLDKDIIAEGSVDEKKQHLLETIVDMVAVKIDELVESDEAGSEPKRGKAKKSTAPRSKKIAPSVSDKKATPISREEVRDFVNIDLNLIDSKAYFDKVFKKRKKGR